jgi:hypothetical protein
VVESTSIRFPFELASHNRGCEVHLVETPSIRVAINASTVSCMRHTTRVTAGARRSLCRAGLGWSPGAVSSAHEQSPTVQSPAEERARGGRPR